MEEKKDLNEEALLSENNTQKEDRKKYIRTIIITAAAVLLAAVAIVIFIVSTAKASDGAEVEPTVAETQETESTTAPEIDILPEPETVPPTTKPSVTVEPTVPPVVETNPTQSTQAVETPSEAPAAPERGEYPIDPPTNDRERLACVIYQEVGGNAQCDECRKRVGDIVLNRVNDPRFPNTIEGVLTQSGQYGRFSWTGIVWQSRAHNAGEKAAVERAYRVADELLAGNHSELYGNGYVWQAGFAQGSGFWCCGHYFGK